MGCEKRCNVTKQENVKDGEIPENIKKNVKSNSIKARKP